MQTRETAQTSRFAAIALSAVVVALACALACASIPPAAYAAQSLAAGSADSGTVAVQSEDVPSLAAAAPSFAGMNVSVRANVKGKGWTSAVAGGKTAGTKSKKILRSVKVSLVGGKDVAGSINYSTYSRGKGWSKVASNGKKTKLAKQGVQYVRMWLDGAVAQHYDVLYRVYIKGRGWQPWAKNKSKAGINKKGLYVGAVQVKLSPKTNEALGNAGDAVGVFYEARLAKKNWQVWKHEGGTAGKANKKKSINRLAVSVDSGLAAGGVQYRVYVAGRKWKQGWKANGQAAGTSTADIQAVQIALTGDVAAAYDVYYRTYVPGYKWLDWAKNGSTAGADGYNLPVAALQVRLVEKGGAAPGKTAAPTVALSRGSVLDGIDISSWQAGIDVAKVPSDFVIVKATGGKGYTNPYFKLHADATLNAGKLLGLYHFARERSCSGKATEEADYFVEAVKPYIGKAVLVLDWEADALLLGPSWAEKFLDRVYAKTGVRPLIYMSKSVTRAYKWDDVADSYPLWVAQYPNYNKTGYLAEPWTDGNGYGAWSAPVMFQYTSSGQLSGYKGNLDLNKFYGTRADWAALAQKS